MSGRRTLFVCCLAMGAGGLGACGDDGAASADASAAHDGSSAGDAAAPPATNRVEGYLRANPNRRLVIEVDSVLGMEPRAAVETDLAALLGPIVDKPDGIAIERDAAIASRGEDHAWSFSELQTLANENVNEDVPDGTISMHTMFVDGQPEDDSDSGVILGIAWANRHIVMFKDTIERTCGAATVPAPIREQVCSAAELAIWTHEVGHVMGLVNNGVPMVTPHQDTEHGAHDESDECVMYWAYEGAAIIDVLTDSIVGGGDPPTFDDACLADLAAVRNGR